MTTYAQRVAELEAEGLTTSDAQGVAEAEGFDPIDPPPTPDLSKYGLSIEVEYTHGATITPWRATVEDRDGFRIVELRGPSAYDVLGEAAKQADRYVAKARREDRARAAEQRYVETGLTIDAEKAVEARRGSTIATAAGVVIAEQRHVDAIDAPRVSQEQAEKALQEVARQLSEKSGGIEVPTGPEAAYRGIGPELHMTWDWPGKPTPTILLESSEYTDWAIEIDSEKVRRVAGVFAEAWAGYALCLYPDEDAAEPVR